MKLGKLLKKLLPVAQTAGTIVVNPNSGGAVAGTLLRQVLMIGGGILTAKGLATNDQVEAAVPALVTLGTVAYGVAKTLKEKKEKVAIVDPAAPAVGVLGEK